ncbi:MAG: DJ-1 family glyoxalase III [Lentisphaeria bacterium]|jgi:4-methyl-5(b-hydroxyethyl)-thiazole monophosphate biosynthesis
MKPQPHLQALVPLAPGFEELEAIAILDVLRRAGIHTLIAAVEGTPAVTGSHNITVQADEPLAAAAARPWHAIVLPGGMPGATNLARSTLLLELLRRTAASGGITAAVCAAPLALHAAGLLQGRRFTCFPSVQPELPGGICTGERVEVDGTLVTGKAAGAAVEFALAIVEALGLREQAEGLRAGMFVQQPPPVI